MLVACDHDSRLHINRVGRRAKEGRDATERREEGGAGMGFREPVALLATNALGAECNLTSAQY